MISTTRWRDPRTISRRILVDGILRLESPCHVGTGESDSCSDSPLLRDGEGRLYLPGSSLAGVLRALTSSTTTSTVWGSAEIDGCQSRLIVSDARLVDDSVEGTELRDMVAIDAASGTAEQKFDIELLPAGTRFRLRFEALVQVEDDSVLTTLAAVLLELEQGIHLGARIRRGFGDARAFFGPEGIRWILRDFRVSSREGLLAWLGWLRDDLPVNWPRVTPKSFPSVVDVARAWGIAMPARTQQVETERRIDLNLRLRSPLIVREATGGDADHEHLQRHEQSTPVPVLPGTSLAGVLRHQCLRIAATLDITRGHALVARMFGSSAPVKEGKRGHVMRASLVSVSESKITDSRVLRHTRVRIDPWLGGAVDNMLFTEDLLFAGDVQPHVAFNSNTSPDADSATALLLLALRDLASGELPVGGEGGVGRGRLGPAGENGQFAVLHLEGRSAALFLAEDGTVSSDAPDILIRMEQALQKWATQET